MKILLVGEFSGFYSCLKEGLNELGHQVTLASSSDGYKKIQGADISFDPKFSGFIGKVENRLRPLVSLPYLKGFDVVQLINPFVFDYFGFPKRYFIEQIKKNNASFFLSACGTDAYYFQVSRQKLRYGPFQDILDYDLNKASCRFQENAALEYNRWVAEISDGIIPIMYDYECGYADQPNLKPTIPLPINIKKYAYSENYANGKITIFHGLSRYGFKGTRHVEEAFRILEEKYPDKLDLRIDGQLPIDEYITIMEKANIVIDQTSCYSTGVNALIAMAQGKVVLGGAEPESLACLGVESTPVVNIVPSAASIISEIENLIHNSEMLSELGKRSRDFVRDHHDHVKIAQRYIDIWSK